MNGTMGILAGAFGIAAMIFSIKQKPVSAFTCLGAGMICMMFYFFG